MISYAKFQSNTLADLEVMASNSQYVGPIKTATTTTNITTTHFVLLTGVICNRMFNKQTDGFKRTLCSGIEYWLIFIKFEA